MAKWQYQQLLSTGLILSSRPSRGTDANQQKLVTVRSYTENYRQSYSIRTVKDWNALPQSVVSAGSFQRHMQRAPSFNCSVKYILWASFFSCPALRSTGSFLQKPREMPTRSSVSQRPVAAAGRKLCAVAEKMIFIFS